jgi:elongation factor P hydroxylase
VGEIGNSKDKMKELSKELDEELKSFYATPRVTTEQFMEEKTAGKDYTPEEADNE